MFSKDYFSSLESVWDTLKNAKSLFVYGTGNGCEKLLTQLEMRQIKVAGIFVSDDFVRGQSFNGFDIQSFSKAFQTSPEMTCALAFGTSLPEVMRHVDSISEKIKLVAPDMSVCDNDVFEKSVLLDDFSKAQAVYDLLADDFSKETFENILAFKITGQLNFLKRIFTTSDEVYKNILALTDSEIYCDCGAYTGDTIEEFLHYTNGNYNKIIAVEPNVKNFRRCVKSLMHLDRIVFANCATWDKNTEVQFSQGAGRQAMQGSGKATDARKIDTILADEDVTYLKLDVEGADVKSLNGARNTILKYSPKLFTALYHRVYDIIDIVLLVHSINPEYKLYIRQYSYYPAWETNLIAKI